jgi:tetratricopeptide (TPR) repeat protein
LDRHTEMAEAKRAGALGAAFAFLLLLQSGAAGASQFYDPADPGASPLTLLQAPADGVSYHRIHIRARQLVDAGQGKAAEPLVEQLVRAYPRDGENWLLLARAKKLVGKHREAAAAYERAGPILGWVDAGYHPTPGRRPIIGMELAASYLAAGDRQAALDTLRREVFERRTLYRESLYNPMFAELREDPEYLEIVGRPNPSAWSRDYGWNRDIDHLVSEVMRVNPDYSNRALPEDFLRRYRSLKENIPRYTDEQIFVGINQMLSVLHQGHVWMRTVPRDGPVSPRLLPVATYIFPDGIFITNATEEHRELVGARILRVQDTPVEETLRRLNSMHSVDGDMEYLVDGNAGLRSVAALLGLGIIGSPDKIRLTLEKGPGVVQEVELATILPGSPVSATLNPPSGAPPLFVQHAARAYWEHALPDHHAHYVQINQIRNDPEESLPAFSMRLRSILADSRATNLIIDLRHNSGGTTQLYPEFLRTVIGFSQRPRTKVYVLIGRTTYSAAANLVTDLERLANPTFVGEATSECCNFYGDPTRVRLPYSGITGAVTAVKWNLSKDVFDKRREMSPHVPIQFAVRDWLAGRDPAIEAVFKMIAEADRS